MRVSYYTDKDRRMFEINETPELVQVSLVTYYAPKVRISNEEPLNLDAEILTLPEWVNGDVSTTCSAPLS